MLLAFMCKDKLNSLEVRLANRPAHPEWLQNTLGVVLAGPLLGEDQKPCGSLLVVEHPDLDAARKWSTHDPYTKAGLFETVEIHEWKKVIGA
jgi:uncharacterized protein YciI